MYLPGKAAGQLAVSLLAFGYWLLATGCNQRMMRRIGTCLNV
jgi:hypothetical protein